MSSMAVGTLAVVDLLGERSGKHPSGYLYGNADLRRAAEELEKESHSHALTSFSYLYQLAATKAWSCLEVMTDSVVAEALSLPTAPRCRDALAKLQGEWLPLLEATPQELPRILLAKLKQQTGAPLKDGVGRLDTLLKLVGLSGAIDSGVRKALQELSAVRNVVVHNRSVADEKFRKNCPWHSSKLGSEVRVSASDFAVYWLAAAVFNTEVATWELQATGSTGIPHAPSIVVRMRGLFQGAYATRHA